MPRYDTHIPLIAYSYTNSDYGHIIKNQCSVYNPPVQKDIYTFCWAKKRCTHKLCHELCIGVSFLLIESSKIK
jgi:hypothetical protein